jgi:AcrR family transcriptional regulator
MPKRDEKYMIAQRDAIARAALNVLLEKGVYASSLRDICKEAGVSMGGLYIHFSTKEEVIVAACALDFTDQREWSPPDTWDAYVNSQFKSDAIQKGSRRSKRFRLSLQFVAEITQMDHNPKGLSNIYHVYLENISRSLAELKQRGIIRLPYGLELTSLMHMQIFSGAEYQIAADKDTSAESAAEAARHGLAVTAGLV